MTSSELTSDIYYEILSRVSLGTLGRCRLVNKEWKRITYEPNTVSLHSRQTGTLRGHLMMISSILTFVPSQSSSSTNHKGGAISLGFLRPVGSGSVTAEVCHMGIVLCRRDGTEKHHHHRVPQFLICKPSTGQSAVIPNPRTRTETMMFNLMVLRTGPPALRFKILRISRNNGTCANYVHSSFRCEVFDSDLWRWRRLEDIGLPVEYFGLCLGDGVTVSGTTYARTKSPEGLFAFDMLNDTWEVMPLPFGELGEFEQAELMKVKGRLGVVRRGWDRTARGVWVMEDRREKVWRMRSGDELNPEDDPGAVKEFHFSRTSRWPEKILQYCSDFEPVVFGPAHIPN